MLPKDINRKQVTRISGCYWKQGWSNHGDEATNPKLRAVVPEISGDDQRQADRKPPKQKGNWGPTKKGRAITTITSHNLEIGDHTIGYRKGWLSNLAHARKIGKQFWFRSG